MFNLFFYFSYVKVALYILIAFSFLFYSVGFQLFYQIQESVNREEIQETVHLKKIEQLRFSFHDYAQLVDTKNEFNFNGNRYDIVAVVPYGDSILVDCYHDQVEEEIAALYSSFIHHFLKGNNGSEKKGTYAKLMVVDYIPVSKQSSTCLIKDAPKEYGYSYPQRYLATAYAVVVPPPQYFV